jgi:hypothetical protein
MDIPLPCLTFQAIVAPFGRHSHQCKQTTADPATITLLDNGSPGTIVHRTIAHHTILKKSMLHDAGIDMYSPDSIAPSPHLA